VLTLSLFVSGYGAFASEPSNLDEENNSNLTKIDTSNIDPDTELYLDLTRLENILVFFNDQYYSVKENKLVKESNLPIIKPFAVSSHKFTLANGQTGTVKKTLYKGTSASWTSYGPKERRRMAIVDDVNGATLGSLTSNSYGVGVTASAKWTGAHRFQITNYSATKQTWNCEIIF